MSTVESPVGYASLFDLVAESGLLERRPMRSVWAMVVAAGALIAGWGAFFAVGNTWWSLAVAVYLAVAFTQVAFVGHDAGHEQIFRSRRGNRSVGLVAGNALTGICFGWWVPKHNAHHAHPNVIGRDPDIGPGRLALTFVPDSARDRPARFLARYQAWLFFPLLMLEGAGLHLSGVDFVLRRRDRSALAEGLLLGLHATVYLAMVLAALSPLRALAFITLQQSLFGLLLGCSFAPNHKGMPILDTDSGLDILDRQILTARNVSGGRFITALLGGLNLQIEHHLFPSMPRANLARAHPIVRAFCAQHGISYREVTLVGSYCQALRFLNRVGSIPRPPGAHSRVARGEAR